MSNLIMVEQQPSAKFESLEKGVQLAQIFEDSGYKIRTAQFANNSIELSLNRPIYISGFPRFHLKINIPVGNNSLTCSLHIDQRLHRTPSFSSNEKIAELHRLKNFISLMVTNPIRNQILNALNSEMLFGSPLNIAIWENRTGLRFDERYIGRRRSRKTKGEQKSLLVKRRQRVRKGYTDDDDYF